MEPLLLKPIEAARALGIGRTKLYELIGAASLETVAIGRARRITRESIDRFIAQRSTGSTYPGGEPKSRR